MRTDEKAWWHGTKTSLILHSRDASCKELLYSKNVLPLSYFTCFQEEMHCDCQMKIFTFVLILLQSTGGARINIK